HRETNSASRPVSASASTGGIPLLCPAALRSSARHAGQFHEAEQPPDAIGRYVSRAVPEPLAGLPEPRARDVDFQGDDGLDADPVPPGDVRRRPAGLLPCRKPHGLEAATSGWEMLCLRGHEGLVIDVTFSPDGLRILSGSGDNTVRVWDAQSGA